MKERFGSVKRVGRKFGILYDTIKGMVIVFIIFVLIVFFASSIIHNLLRIIEVSNGYTGKYKNLYNAGNEMMNIYTVGDNEKTIVILPAFGKSSPIMEYKGLADYLSSFYRVVIVEPLGYGYSLSTKEERTSEKIVNELRDGLNNAEIYGPYILMTFQNSSLYANYYSEKYPEEVSGIVSIDGIYPESLENEEFKDKYLPNLMSNVRFYSIASLSGIFRWECFVTPERFNLDKAKNNNAYGQEELKIYRNRIANKFLTKAMRNEFYKLKDNLEEQKNFKYSQNLPTLQIITTNYRDEYSERNENLAKYAKNLITNDKIQVIRTLEGDVSDYIFDTSMSKQIKNLISMYF